MVTTDDAAPPSTSTTDDRAADVVVIGTGVAGLAAAVAASEGAADARVVVLEAATEEEAGGNSRWTSAYLRVQDPEATAPGFVDDVLDFSDGRSPRDHVERLDAEIPGALAWAQQLGARFQTAMTHYLSSNRPRWQPVGGGAGLRSSLLAAALERGVEVRYGTRATALRRDADGRVTGVDAEGPNGLAGLDAAAVVVASGGFEGSADMMAAEVGDRAHLIRQISPGGEANTGEGIAMALAAGAGRAGEWSSFHAEPVDARSEAPESVVMLFPYGLLVDAAGRRFMDEGASTVDEAYEHVARTVWAQDGGAGYLLLDQRAFSIPDWQRAVPGPLAPVMADTVADLARALGLDPQSLGSTVEEVNAATPQGAEADWDWSTLDGVAATAVSPPKSNWAAPLVAPPFAAYPLSCAIVFTFGGLATDLDGRVLDSSSQPVEGLYAAGECTGLYFGKYPGATSILRGLVFGRLAGAAAAARSRAAR